MAHSRDKLTALAVEKMVGAGKPVLKSDGGGLYLRVQSKTAASWVFRYGRGVRLSSNGKRMPGKITELGLGRYGNLDGVSLARARDKAADLRRLISDGRDPLAEREAARQAALIEAAKAVTFEQAAGAYIDAHRAGWKNAKHAEQWPSTLKTYAYQEIGELPVASIETAHVMNVLRPIWTDKPETAGRVRGRIESVLDWATTSGYRSGDNPARWRGHLDNLLPKKSKVRKVKHHAALPYAKVGAFVAELRKKEGTAARSLEFTILTAARTGETIGAQWSEIDFAGKMWTVPAERMKSGKEHRIPLSARAMEILEAMRGKSETYVFPGGKKGQPLSNMAMAKVLKDMGLDVTVHGFRSTFRDWAAETTHFPNEVVEMALAHTVSDKVEAAYRRGDLFEKRRALADQWATYCATPSKDGTVVPMQRTA